MLECKLRMNLQKVESLALLYMSIYPFVLNMIFLWKFHDTQIARGTKNVKKQGLFMVCKNTFQDLEQIALTPYMVLLVMYLCYL